MVAGVIHPPPPPFPTRQMRRCVLKSVPLLSSLSDDKLDEIAGALRVVVYSDGRVIINPGEQEGTSFFIINAGEVKCTKVGKEPMRMSAGDFSGERALLRRGERAASTNRGRVECVVLNSWESTRVVRPGSRAFGELLGDLQDIVVPTRTAFLPGMWSPTQAPACINSSTH